MREIEKGMSINEYLDTLNLDRLCHISEQADKRISKILDQDKVDVWIFHSGVVNEGFFFTKDEAVEALKKYVIFKDYHYTDKLSVFKIREQESEADRLVNGD